MVWKWKYDENYGILRVLLSRNTRKKMMLDLKERGDYSNQNDYMFGQIIHDAWDWFKKQHSLPEKNNEKRELISVEWSRKEAYEIMDWATKWGLLYIVLEEYYESKEANKNFSIELIRGIGEKDEDNCRKESKTSTD